MATKQGPTSEVQSSPRPRRVVLPVGSRICQCGGCREVFNSLGAFDKHRTGSMDERRCLSPAEMTAAGMAINIFGRWVSSTDSRYQEEDDAQP